MICVTRLISCAVSAVKILFLSISKRFSVGYLFSFNIINCIGIVLSSFKLITIQVYSIHFFAFGISAESEITNKQACEYQKHKFIRIRKFSSFSLVFQQIKFKKKKNKV